jgi:hypothetical protein
MSVPAYLSVPAPRPPADDSPPRLRTMRTESFAGALALLIDARTCLHEAERAVRTQDRYAAAYLAAVRAANAVLTARTAPPGNARPVSVWRLLRQVAPEFGDWAQLFAAHSDRRALAEAGVPIVPGSAADDLVLQAGTFVDAVGRSLSWVAR